ncbi:MAG: hypothetical protein A2736_02665 [Candidatus Yanofskybacteria bacterium RIFCSPHIGHO2_01_FULL_41_27]|uniref:Uncharacterized protein n=3 Tax=Parcubacteria group TaxID=1794811 RepID=A0A1F8HVB2_9BACT|nr:MAG: hypothetical protein UU83_C0046G0004 [Candidatus Jorgensenbacteria bacterium GW2011_GWF2_41_8]OGN00597.1 MAG: hypothetical protein A2736_02665 [Candidatus Yanofskybacteria bacterium RIFCSPHIGHO2_01_FULL_41_27]OGN09205.1 MAG: hypothetical protein A3C64_00475 [Candidatus Yanofskybacteria bacterium RIFCSPHIGHO2_02_FULL_41_12]OGN40866.1 MAG: hypothetical protein A2606_02625 [Candidatus Yanofskybacteria bacterium RIFOXYD1_FULL_42_10]
MSKSKLIISSACAAVITIAFVVIVTIWAELSAPIKAWLQNFSGHHWTTKSIFSALIYAIATMVLYVLPYNPNPAHLRKKIICLLVATILGVAVLTAFYAAHHFGIF